MAQNNEQGFTPTMEKPQSGHPKNYFKNRLSEIKSHGWGNFALNNSIYILFIVFLVVAIIIGYATGSGKFFDSVNMLNNIRDMALIMFAALGVGSILILSGVDLSSPYIISFLAFLSAALLTSETSLFRIFPNMSPWPFPVVLIVVMVVGGLFGAFNGFFVSKFKLNTFIVTLATQVMLVAFVKVFSTMGGGRGMIHGEDKVPQYTDFINKNFNLLGGQLYLFVFYAIIAVLITWFIWNKTKLGKNMYAIGSNLDAAKVSGVNITKTIIMVFAFTGLMYGFSAWVYGGYTDGMPTLDMNLGFMGSSITALDALAACLIGGISLTGGVGKVRNIVIGVIIIQLISYSLQLVGIMDSSYRDIIKGALILFAIVIDMRRYLTKR